MLRVHTRVMRGMVAAVAATAALGGCAQIAGIDSTNGDNRPGDSVSVKRASIGTMVATSPLDITGLQATYLVPSSAPGGFDRVMAVPVPAEGKWTTKLHTPAAVELTLPDSPVPIPRLLSYAAQQISLVFGVLEHPDPQAAPAGASFLIAPLNTPVGTDDVFTAFAVGTWLTRSFAATEIVPGSATIAPPMFAFVASNSLTGRPQIDLMTTDDKFLLLRYVGTQLTGYAEADPFGQVVPTTMVTTGEMTTVTPDQMLQVTFNANDFTTRLGLPRPAPTPASLSMHWQLDASPGHALGVTKGPSLHGVTTIMSNDMGVNGQAYANPFAARGWNTTLTVTAGGSRMYTAPPETGMPTGAGFTLANTMTQIIEPSAGADIAMPAGLPTGVTVDGTRLSVDGQTIAPPTQPVAVSFTTDLPAVPAEIYGLQVFDLLPSSAPNPTLVLAMGAETPAFEIPPEVFQTGHTYTLRAISTVTPLPGLAQGDFTIRSLPLSESFSDSAAFTVTP